MTTPLVGAGRASTEPVVRLEGLTKIYKTGGGEVRALNGISFIINPGEMVALMGPSGSGKSTLMNILGCLDRATDGKYFLDGVDVSKLSDGERADIRCKRIGFVFQSFNLIPRLSALDNVALPIMYSDAKTKSHERAMAALDKVGLAKRAHHRPSQMSGGEQQRAAIARSLVNHPSFILADEPTGNLDSRTSSEIMTVFRELQDQGITVVVVTHEADIAEWCGRTIFIRDGELLRDERHTPRAVNA
ncbi:MAG: ABC transporter ATP-binding protein [Dehalococcoidia bacterium]|nr:ABC transporter ATP-binding protein [Dehalococcoidia bacterium]